MSLVTLFSCQESPATTPSAVAKQQPENVNPKVEAEIRTVPDGGSATSFNEITSSDPVQVCPPVCHLT